MLCIRHRILQAIGIDTISRRWVLTTALNHEYAEKERQQEKMLCDKTVHSLDNENTAQVVLEMPVKPSSDMFEALRARALLGMGLLLPPRLCVNWRLDYCLVKLWCQAH